MLAQETMNLLDIFEDHKGLVINKFPHHLEIYDRLFRSLQNKTGLTLLEIGLGSGGSLQLWREYFGPQATIIGVDVQDLTRLEVEAKVLVGDQGSVEFWGAVKPQLGAPDIIIDDGSHRCADQILTFRQLFPVLADGGVYIVEDIHTSYREAYGGGLGNPGSFVEFIKMAIDGIHSPEHGGPGESHLFSVQVYPNLAVIEKRSPSTWGGSTMRPA